MAPITVSAIVATAVTPLFFDRVSPYSVTASPSDWGLIPVVLGLGACAAVLAIVFMRSLLRTAAWAKARNNDLAMLLLAATVMAMIGMLVPEAVGLGTQSVNDLLAGEKLVGEAALMLVAKLAATVVCIGLGLVGGVSRCITGLSGRLCGGGIGLCSVRCRYAHRRGYGRGRWVSDWRTNWRGPDRF